MMYFVYNDFRIFDCDHQEMIELSRYVDTSKFHYHHEKHVLQKPTISLMQHFTTETPRQLVQKYCFL